MFDLEIFHLSRILGLAAASFIIALSWTPILVHYLRKYKLGKQVGKQGKDLFNKLHAKKEGTLTMGGILIWMTVLFLTLVFWFIGKVGQGTVLEQLNFLSRGETLLPLGVLVASALAGAADDLLGTFKVKKGGLKIRHQLLIFMVIAVFGAWWFFYKLDWDLIHIPFVDDFNIGWFYIPVFIFIIIATTFSVSLTDGLDGLAGGVLMIAFGAYGIIAFSQGKMDLAVFCGAILGALLAFLWFNIYPARFFMGHTGSTALGVTLGVIAMLTNTFLLLPLIAFIPVLETVSDIIQMSSKKIRKKPVFLAAPIHHHFEAKGWPETKVTMRFWIISGVTAGIGLILFFAEQLLR